MKLTGHSLPWPICGSLGHRVENARRYKKKLYEYVRGFISRDIMVGDTEEIELTGSKVRISVIPNRHHSEKRIVGAIVNKDSSADILLNAQANPLKTKGGKTLQSYTCFPKKKGNWEQVSYAGEGDFYLIFTISSRSRKGFSQALKVYEQYIGQYEVGP